MTFPPQLMLTLSRPYWVTRASSVLTGSSTIRSFDFQQREGKLPDGSGTHPGLFSGFRYRLTPASAEIKNRWSYNSIPSIYFPGMDRNSFYCYTGPITIRSAHTVYLCVLCGSEKKQRLFPYTTLTDWFVWLRRSLFTAHFELNI
jgi:hypothetical protein